MWLARTSRMNMEQEENHSFLFRSDAKVSSIALLNAETVLHDYWGGPEYWMVRRSMRFNLFLVEIANNFRREVLNSTDAYDATERPNDWRHEMVFPINNLIAFTSPNTYSLNTNFTRTNAQQWVEIICVPI